MCLDVCFNVLECLLLILNDFEGSRRFEEVQKSTRRSEKVGGSQRKSENVRESRRKFDKVRESS